MVQFATVVLGPPGSGKTTACFGMQQFFELTKRPVAVVNLDPANDSLPYHCDINISELITLDDVMTEFGLGPNGGLIYCLEYLEKNMDWLTKRLEAFKDRYFIFDLPGQVELYTHHKSVRNVLAKLEKLDYRLCVLNMVDAHLCTDPSKYIAALVLSLKTMIHLEHPHLNVLSKIDLIESYGKLAFNLDFYTEVQDLSYLVDRLSQDRFAGARLAGLSKALCELVEEFGLVGFQTLCVTDKASMVRLVSAVDKANGYVFAGMESQGDGGKAGGDSIFSAVGQANDYLQMMAEIKERYIEDDE
ncbi:hypothetical protein HK101_011410 [Irineochytrium annulatum]|nr:hypothetical protein HK101_011410 [Irineochytrium annulatum]